MPERLVKNLLPKLTAGSSVTPNRIEMFIKSNGARNLSEELWMDMPESVVAIFYSRKGNLHEKKYRKFLKSLELLTEEYSPIDLIKMDESCIKKDGSINETQFRAVLSQCKSHKIPKNI